MSLTEHLLANATNKRYSYCVRVRGLPYLWDDGRGTWDPTAMDIATPYPTVMRGGLNKTAWTFTYESNPLEPLDVGNGINIELICDAGGITRSMFAPEIEVEEAEPTVTEIASDVSVIEFVDGTASWVVGTNVYMGLETMQVTVESAPEYTLDRGCFGSLARRFTGYFEGSGDGYEMIKATNYPTVWRGRYVDIWMGEVMDDNTIGDIWKVWAGRLEAFDLTVKNVRLQVEPLTNAILKDYWPKALGECSTGTDTLNIQVHRDNLYIVAGAADTLVTGSITGNRQELGTYNTSGVFEVYVPSTDVQWYTLEQLAQMMNDTLIYIAIGISSVGQWAYLYNNFSVYVENANDRGRGVGEDGDWGTTTVRKYIRYDNDTRIQFSVEQFGPLSSMISTRFLNRISANTRGAKVYDLAFRAGGFGIGLYDSRLQALPNDRRFYPSLNEGCYDFENTEMRAYVAISNGKESELVSVNAIGITRGDGIVNMEVAERGLGGTTQRSWGGVVDSGLTNVTLKQVCAVKTGSEMDVADVLLYLLTSIDGAAGGTNGTYDILGPGTGLGIPADLVDTVGIRAKLNIGDMPKPNLFWIEDAGKGKEALENFMKYHGIYFVARRFTVAGEERFGLSVDLVDVPLSTRYNLSLTDSHIKAHDEPRVNVNERLTINQIAVSPTYVFGQSDKNQGGKRYAYAEQSIRKYGAAKALELSASTYFTNFSSRFVGDQNDEAAIATSIALAVGQRWFAAYSDGNYTISTTMPHVGWAVQAGDNIKLTLTNVANPDGSVGIVNRVAKVMDVKHKHGSNPGADVTLRISVADAVELCPSFRVAASSGSTITLTDNEFSFTGDGVIPPFDDDTSPTHDGQWFNYDRHGAGLRIRVWIDGNYAGVQTYTVTGTSLVSGNWVLTLNAAFNATLATAVSSGNVRVIGTFADYANAMSALRSQYAYIGSNDRPPVLGSLDGTLTDVPAKRWN